MDMKSICTWDKVPDNLILENMWIMSIDDENRNQKVLFGSDNDFDLYVKSVSIPLNSISYDKTNFGKLNIKERNLPSSVSITFVDSTKSPYVDKFNKWLYSIYNFDNNCVMSNWRLQSKTIRLTQINILKNKNVAKLLMNNLGGVGAIANAWHIDLSDIKIQKIAEHTLCNCYISKIDDFDFGVDSGEPKEFSIELECEKSKSIYYNGGTTYID